MTTIQMFRYLYVYWISLNGLNTHTKNKKFILKAIASIYSFFNIELLILVVNKFRLLFFLNLQFNIIFVYLYTLSYFLDCHVVKVIANSHFLENAKLTRHFVLVHIFEKTHWTVFVGVCNDYHFVNA
jgi:hypothetical protein